jgi:hypothetical protein
MSSHQQNPYVADNRSESEAVDLADREDPLGDPHFLNFLHGNVATTHSAAGNNVYSQRVPHTQHPAGTHTHNQGNIRQSIPQMSLDPSSLFPVFPPMDQQRYLSGNSAQQHPFSLKQFQAFESQNEAVPRASSTFVTTSSTTAAPNRTSHGSLQDQRPTANYHSAQSCRHFDRFPIFPDPINSYYATLPYPTLLRGSTLPNVQADTLSVPDDEPDSSRRPTKRPRVEASPEAESNIYGTACTHLGHVPNTRAAKKPAKAKEPRSKRSLSSHSYDPYLGHFNSWIEARDELFGVKWTPPATADIPMTDQQKIPFVMQVYNAMTDFSEFYDKQGAKGDNRMLRQKAYDSRYIEARSWEVVVSTQQQ